MNSKNERTVKSVEAGIFISLIVVVVAFAVLGFLLRSVVIELLYHFGG